MKRVYPTILTVTNDAVLVEVPDLEILTEGTDISNAIEMARDAIGIAGISIQDHGDEIPEPSECKSIKIKKFVAETDPDAFATIMPVTNVWGKRFSDIREVDNI